MNKFFGHKIGDTLIEVTLAIGIFSLVAITVVSVISGSTSDAQANLETTVTREAIDTQAEALRFLQSSAVENGGSGTLAEAWNYIKDLAQDPGTNNNTEYNVTSCSEIYNDNHKYLNDIKAFIINPNELSSNNKKNIVKLASEDTSNQIFKTAGAYPRLYYRNTGIAEDVLLNDNNGTFGSAEGIFIVPVKGDNTTIFDGKDFKSETSYYDFYIRSCWYEPGDNNPSIISTVVRLYDPESMSENSSFEVTPEEVKADPTNYITVTFDLQNGSTAKKTCVKNKSCTISKSYIKEQEIFKGWVTNMSYCSEDNKIIKNGSSQIFSSNTTLYPCTTKITYTITLHSNEKDKSDKEKTIKKNAGDTFTLEDARQLLNYSPEPGYTFADWNTEKNHTGTTFLQGTEIVVNRNLNLYASWKIERTIQSIRINETCKTLAKNHDYWVRDERYDNKTQKRKTIANYTIRWINGNCWMTSDLKVKSTSDNPLSADGSNFSGSSYNINTGSSSHDHIYPGGKRIATIPISTTSYTYNFCAAVAGTGSGCELKTEYTAGGDICPTNWKIPDNADTFRSAAETGLLSIGEKRYWTTKKVGPFDGSGNYMATPPITGGGYSMRILTNSIYDGNHIHLENLPRTYFMSIRCVHK